MYEKNGIDMRGLPLCKRSEVELFFYSKTCVIRSLKKAKTKILITNVA